MTTERANWTAWGFAGAVALPSGRLNLGPNVRIEHFDADRLDELGGGAPRPEHPEVPWPAYFSALSTQVIVRSGCVISIRTEATTREEAWDRIERIQVPPVIAALAAYGSPAPRIELLRIAKTDTNGIMSESTSRWAGGTLGGFGSRDLTEEEATAVVARHAAGGRYAADICRLYNDAIRQHDLSDLTPRSLGNVILNYFLVVEAIARREKDGGSIAGTDVQIADKQIQKLQKALSTEAPVAVHAKHIRATLRDLDRLERRYLNQKIEAAVARLGLDPSVYADALEIANLRNTTLSHPGRDLSQSLGEMAVVAERTARAFLTSFIDAHVS